MLHGDVHVVATLIPTVRLYEAATILQMLSNVGTCVEAFGPLRKAQSPLIRELHDDLKFPVIGYLL